MREGNKIRVLIVDDSAIVRKILSETLSAESDIEVVGTAPDPFIARDKIIALNPDVLTLDIEMPRMDGLTFLKRLMRYHPMPVIVISSLTQASSQPTMEALSSGAVEVLPKPGGPYSVGDLRSALSAKIRAAASARVRQASAETGEKPPIPMAVTGTPAFAFDSVIAIGASTGGTEAISQVLQAFPEKVPGIVIAQHIPPVFSHAFAERLGRTCRFEVREAKDGESLVPGLALVAPGDFHMTLHKSAGKYHVAVRTGPKVCYQRPSIDVLFSSVAQAAGSGVTAALLTGMGADGAQGLLRIRQSQGHTIAQDEATCVVFGMPREAIRLGATDEVLPLPGIASALLAPRSVAPTQAARVSI